jgi:hypothetical protein
MRGDVVTVMRCEENVSGNGKCQWAGKGQREGEQEM